MRVPCEPRRPCFSLAQAFTPGSRVGHPFFDSPIYGARIAPSRIRRPPEGGRLIPWFVLVPRRSESVSEPRADRGPHAGSPRGVVEATGSLSFAGIVRSHRYRSGF